MLETHGRLVAIMFVQVTEPSANDRELPVDLIRSAEYKKAIGDHLKRYHGDLIDVRTGEIFASFPGAEVAFSAAISMQQMMHRFNLRIGLHIGEVLYRKGRFEGAAVNLTSRLPDCARAGGICMSEPVYRYLGEADKQKLISLGTHDLRNFDAGMSLYAWLPVGQPSRSWTREFRRLLNSTFRRYLRHVLLLSMSGMLSIFFWQHTSNSSLSEYGMVNLYLPRHERHSLNEQINKLSDSIDMTIRSRLSSLERIHLSDEKSNSGMALQLTHSLSSEWIRVGYTLTSLPEGGVLSTGVFEAEYEQLFHVQDNLFDHIFAELRRQKITQSTLAPEIVRAKLNSR